jgi:hypothetical protein
MGIAAGATDFSAAHEEGPVGMLADRAFLDRSPEARPAGTGIELGIGREQRLAAADAGIHARALLVPIGAGEGALRAVLTRNMKLLRRELLAPFGLGLGDFGTDGSDFIGNLARLGTASFSRAAGIDNSRLVTGT